MQRITITIIILCVFCFYAVAQKSNTTEEKIPKEGPDILIMKQLSNQYVPVRFKHKLHIQPMAIMGIECSACHHYSSPDSFPPCRKCHSQTRNEINSTFPLSRPSLQSAYHRKCVNCHQEWSRDIIECSSCHVEKVAGESDKSRVTVAGDVDQEHPVIESSDRKIYETKYHGGTKVTFLHKEHVELFEIDCVDCHREVRPTNSSMMKPCSLSVRRRLFSVKNRRCVRSSVSLSTYRQSFFTISSKSVRIWRTFGIDPTRIASGVIF